MPIVIILLLVVAVSPLEWPEPFVPLTPQQTIYSTVGLVVAWLVVSILFSGIMTRLLNRNPTRRSVYSTRYVRWRQMSFYVNVAISAVAIFLLGWGKVVQEQATIPWQGRSILAPFAEFLVPGPYLLG
jgi:hypothetical protein